MDPVYALDVSNWQAAGTTTPDALAALIQRIGLPIQHVVIRAGLLYEGPALRQIAQQQIAAATALGLTYSLYGWAYAAYPAVSTVADMVTLWQEIGATPPAVYWADMEDQDPAPDGNWALAFIAACQQYQLPLYGVYSGAWWTVQYLQGVDLSGVWYWIASYDQQPTLGEPGSNGMIVVGHQYSDRAADGEALDLDVFTPQAAGLC